MTEQLTFKLRKQQINRTGVKIRYADFETHTMQKRIPYTADHIYQKQSF